MWQHMTGRQGSSNRPATTLDAGLRAEIQHSFDEASHDEEHFPSTVDPRIQHVQVLLRFFGDLTDKQVLDVGCGKGRFARVLQEQNPCAEIWGLDISEEMLRFVPAGIHTKAGSMTELPFADSTFDFVYATESLEHAVDIERAVNEMCRVVKPGGKLAIIDKNAEHWGRLKTSAWERWFTRGELEKLLARNCKKVHSEFLSYWEDVAPDGLFLVWYAYK
jgi:ubiquinone/menaquinone biosynthesis C-methylase UbiE